MTTLAPVNYKLHSLTAEQKTLIEEGNLLPVMEDFYTIQGEGYNTGKAAHFIRIGGCDVGCHWCDVKESWDANLHPLTSLEDLLQKVKTSQANAVVVTGGEPLIYNLDQLCLGLKKNNCETFIETSGAYPLSGIWDWICLSPKKTMPAVDQIYSKANELKVIIYNKHDFIWAEKEAEKLNSNCYLFLQAEWSKREELMPQLVDYVKTHPKWMISIQAHKYMNVP